MDDFPSQIIVLDEKKPPSQCLAKDTCSEQIRFELAGLLNIMRALGFQERQVEKYTEDLNDSNSITVEIRSKESGLKYTLTKKNDYDVRTHCIQNGDSDVAPRETVPIENGINEDCTTTKPSCSEKTFAFNRTRVLKPINQHSMDTDLKSPPVDTSTPTKNHLDKQIPSSSKNNHNNNSNNHHLLEKLSAIQILLEDCFTMSRTNTHNNRKQSRLSDITATEGPSIKDLEQEVTPATSKCTYSRSGTPSSFRSKLKMAMPSPSIVQSKIAVPIRNSPATSSFGVSPKIPRLGEKAPKSKIATYIKFTPKVPKKFIKTESTKSLKKPTSAVQKL